MRILQITSTFFPVHGGQESVVYEISRRMIKEGHKVDVLTTDLFCNKKVKRQESIDGMKVIRLKNDLYLGGYGFSTEAKRWLENNWKKYDIVHSHGYNRFLSEFSVGILGGKIPVVFTPHGFIHTKKNYFFKVVHDLTLGKWIRKADKLTALTKLDFIDYRRLGIEKEKIIEIPNGVDVGKFGKEEKREVSKFKKKYGLLKTVLFVGRIHESKGLQYLVDSIKGINCKLILAGDDAGYKKELERKIENLGIGDKVIFTGHLGEREKIAAYHACDVFVLFSEWEGFGITVIEAMASGKPVIVSNRGSLPFLVKDKEDGFIIKFKDISHLKEKIEFLLKNRKVSRKIGANGLKKAKSYDWKNVMRMYSKTYGNLLEAKNE